MHKTFFNILFSTKLNTLVVNIICGQSFLLHPVYIIRILNARQFVVFHGALILHGCQHIRPYIIDIDNEIANRRVWQYI